MAYNSSLAFAKLSSDSLTSMVLGTTTGGLQLLKSTIIKLITGTEEELSDKLLIYPNPTDKIVTIKSPEEVSISLFSTSGKLIFEGIKVLPNLETQLDLSKAPTGIYIVEARSKQHTITRQKIVVSR